MKSFGTRKKAAGSPGLRRAGNVAGQAPKTQRGLLMRQAVDAADNARRADASDPIAARLLTPSLGTTVAELKADYLSDPTSAESRYKGQYLSVSGSIAKISGLGTANPVVFFDASSKSGAMAVFRKEDEPVLRTLDIRQNVKFNCSMVGFDGGREPTFKNCSLASR